MLQLLSTILDRFRSMPSLWLLMRIRFVQVWKKVSRFVKALSFPKRKTMSQYPLRYLPIPVRDSIHQTLLKGGYIVELPFSIKIRGDKLWTYFIAPKSGCTAFLLRVNLSNKQSELHVGEFEGRGYAPRDVDRDKTKRNLENGTALVRGYFMQRDAGPAIGMVNVLHPETEVVFHPAQVLKPLPEVKMDDRDRKILFCYGSLKEGGLRRQALDNLGVTKAESESLAARGLLKKVGGGYAITMLSEANRLPRPLRGEKVAAVDQW
jgi:hypothetical protein